jgi:hypothetical protein
MEDPMYKDLNEDQWLLSHARNVVSQTGEDGILEKIFEVLGITQGWCVEFGAWDGKHFSNTFNLITNHLWSGVLIEADKRKFKALQETYRDNPRVLAVNKFVSFDGPERLDSLLGGTSIPRDFDLLSIDIDGADYHIWNTLQLFKPKVICIEHNGSVPHNIEFVQSRDMSVYQGASPLALKTLGKQKGYELLSINIHNSIFVREKYYPAFNIRDNCLDRLWPKEYPFIQMYVLFDGTLVLHGSPMLPWHDAPIRQDKIQVLPRYVRFLTYTKGPLRRFIQRAYLHLYRRNLII